MDIPVDLIARAILTDVEESKVEDTVNAPLF